MEEIVVVLKKLRCLDRMRQTAFDVAFVGEVVFAIPTG